MNALSRLLTTLCLMTALSPSRAADDQPVQRLQPALDAVVAADARLETLYQADTVFDGATWVGKGAAGYFIFSDVPGDTILRLNADGSTAVVVDHIFAGNDISQAYQSFGVGGQKKFWMVGANGTTLDRQGRIVYCAYSNGQIVRLEADGQRTVLASRFEDFRLNGPNDLVYRSDGALYFTDSRAGTRRPDGAGVPYKGLYVLKAGAVALLSKDIEHPNGLAFSPDEKYLYIANTLGKNILRFDVEDHGVAHSQVLADVSGDEVGAPDGIKVDRKGNLYCTGPGGLWILSSTGQHLGTIRTPKQVTNLAFGGRDAKMLYMTAFGAVYRIPLRAAGR